MNKSSAAALMMTCTLFTATASAADGHVYAGPQIGAIALDDDRGVGLDDPILGGVNIGYSFNPDWAAELSLGTDIGGDTDMDYVGVNVLRYLRETDWRPYLAAGISQIAIDDVVEEKTEQVHAGVGVARMLKDDLELRASYRHYYDVGHFSNNDDAVMVSLNWHFGSHTRAPAPQAQPESVAAAAEVVETVELLVQFAFDKSAIRSVYELQFREIADFMKRHPDLDMTIEGHTCNIGSEVYNQGLSERRAEAVRQKFARDFGIDPARMRPAGYGESRPVADNGSKEGRARNRRAIAVILQPKTGN